MDSEDGSSTDDEAAQVPSVKHKTRFFGSKTLSPDRTAADFRNIAEEVVQNLRLDLNTKVTVRIEIEAVNRDGFTVENARTVSENARTLKFDQAGFEEE